MNQYYFIVVAFLEGKFSAVEGHAPSKKYFTLLLNVIFKKYSWTNKKTFHITLYRLECDIFTNIIFTITLWAWVDRRVKGRHDEFITGFFVTQACHFHECIGGGGWWERGGKVVRGKLWDKIIFDILGEGSMWKNGCECKEGEGGKEGVWL